MFGRGGGDARSLTSRCSPCVELVVRLWLHRVIVVVKHISGTLRSRRKQQQATSNNKLPPTSITCTETKTLFGNDDTGNEVNGCWGPPPRRLPPPLPPPSTAATSASCSCQYAHQASAHETATFRGGEFLVVGCCFFGCWLLVVGRHRLEALRRPRAESLAMSCRCWWEGAGAGGQQCDIHRGVRGQSYPGEL